MAVATYIVQVASHVARELQEELCRAEAIRSEMGCPDGRNRNRVALSSTYCSREKTLSRLHYRYCCPRLYHGVLLVALQRHMLLSPSDRSF